MTHPAYGGDWWDEMPNPIEEEPEDRPYEEPKEEQVVEKKRNVDPKFLEVIIQDQAKLIASCIETFESIHGTVVEAVHLLEEETVDDIFGVGDIKDTVEEMMMKINKWEKPKEQL